MSKMRGGMEFVAGRPIRLPPPPESLSCGVLRLRCPERPEVVVGQMVRRGDPLTRPIRESVAFHLSPVAGTVRRVQPAEAAGAGYDVVVEPSSPASPTTLDVAPPRGRKLDVWFNAIRQIGPWHDNDGNVGLIAQLDAARAAPPDTLICVGLDAFAPIADRSSLLVSFPDDAVLGTLVLADLLGVKQATMLAAKTAPVLARLRQSCRNYRLNLTAVHNVYPAAETTLVVAHHASGRRRLPHGSNPVTRGVVVVTPWTAIRIGRWYTLRRLDVARPVMIAWPTLDAPLTAHYALPGQELSSVDPRLAPPMAKGLVVEGSPMTAPRLDHTTDAPAVVSGSGMVWTVLSELRASPPGACISCGWCGEVCPTRLQPIHLAQLCNSRRDDAAMLDQLPWCVDCGLCSYACPASIPLAQTLRGTVAAMSRML